MLKVFGDACLVVSGVDGADVLSGADGRTTSLSEIAFDVFAESLRREDRNIAGEDGLAVSVITRPNKYLKKVVKSDI